MNLIHFAPSSSFLSVRVEETPPAATGYTGHVGRKKQPRQVTTFTHRAPGAIPHEDFTVNENRSRVTDNNTST
jgi:hypothetical protein